jgi:hypothetical protein
VPALSRAEQLQMLLFNNGKRELFGNIISAAVGSRSRFCYDASLLQCNLTCDAVTRGLCLAASE